MTNILTNKLDLEIYYENIFKDHKVVVKELVHKEDNNFNKKSAAMKKFKKETKVLAYLLDENRLIYLLDKKEAISDEDSKLLPLFEFKKIKKNLVANMMIKLLIHHQVLFDIESSFNKVLYITKISGGLIVAVEFYIDKNNFLTVGSKSFKKFNANTATKKELSKTRYSKENNVLILKGRNTPKSQLYIQGIYEKKELLEYFTKSKKKYSITKSYMSGLFLENIKKYLSDYIKVDLSYMNMEIKSNEFKYKYNYDNVNKKDLELIDYAKKTIKELNIINKTSFDIKKIIPYFAEVLENTKMNISNSPKIGEFNLIFTYKKEYYKTNDIKDVYLEIKRIDPFSQSCQLEEKKMFNKIKVNAMIKELLIKNDIKNNKITLADKNKIKTLYLIEKKKEEKTKVRTVKIHKLELDALNMKYELLTSGEEYKKLLNAPYSPYGDINTIIEDYNGNISAIIDTNMHAVVDYVEMLKYSKDGDSNNSSFSISKKNKSCYEFIKSIYGLKTFKLDDYSGYIVGKYDNTSSYSKNDPARLIYPLYGNSVDIDVVLSSLEHYFVKNKDITVMPYQLKYLKEIIEIKNSISE